VCERHLLTLRFKATYFSIRLLPCVSDCKSILLQVAYHSITLYMTVVLGVWERSEGKGVWFLQFFNKIIHFYAYFGQNRCFKSITHHLKAFKINLNVLNRINKVQVLSYSYKCNKIWRHIFHKRGLTPKTPHGYATGAYTWASAAGSRRGPCPPWNFIHDTEEVEGGLMVLFFGLVFSVGPPFHGNFSADALAHIHKKKVNFYPVPMSHVLS